MKFPENLKYTKTDEWVRLYGTTAVVGISDYAQNQLSDIVFVETLISPGDIVKKGMLLATIESVKAAADVNLPISGKVLEVNEALPTSPEQLNNDPYEKAWIAKIEMTAPAETNELMNSNAYQAYCDGREH